ncbi:hypothetical protein BT69DRAFT_1288233 [Atractiella rhizophila]|nr:hypothetical protein BT69DRAFT_1288233 [Atractiella rhizophila]
MDATKDTAMDTTASTAGNGTETAGRDGFCHFHTDSKPSSLSCTDSTRRMITGLFSGSGGERRSESTERKGSGASLLGGGETALILLSHNNIELVFKRFGQLIRERSGMVDCGWRWRGGVTNLTV